ncbi:MAG: hypothetical protein JST51_10830 [Armatimonadetes bacterium]|nr:hypothetical protein [Armatimonadota bacterium]
MKDFKAVWGRRLDEIVLSLLFTSLLVGTLYEAITGGSVIFWWQSILWLVMSCGALGYLLFSICEIRLNGDQIVLRSLVRTKTLDQNQIASIDLTVAGKSSTIAIKDTNRKGYTVLLKSFPEPSVVTSEVQIWWSLHHHDDKTLRPGQVLRFRMTGLSLMLIGLTTFMAIPLWVLPFTSRPDMLPSLWISVPFIIGLFALGITSLMSYVAISDEGILMKRLGAPRRIPWESIQSVRLATATQRGSTNERVIVQADGKPIWINEAFDHLPQIRDLILAHVPPNIVTDDRWRI